METLPDFVTDAEAEMPRRRSVGWTGWEAVVFQLDDEPESELSTAAFAP